MQFGVIVVTDPQTDRTDYNTLRLQYTAPQLSAQCNKPLQLQLTTQQQHRHSLSSITMYDRQYTIIIIIIITITIITGHQQQSTVHSSNTGFPLFY